MKQRMRVLLAMILFLLLPCTAYADMMERPIGWGGLVTLAGYLLVLLTIVSIILSAVGGPQTPEVRRFLTRSTGFLAVLSCLTLISGEVLHDLLGEGGLPKSIRLRSDTRRRLRTLQDPLERYFADCGAFPTRADGLSALRDNPGVDGWRGPYVRSQKMLVDGWKTPIEYSPVTHGNEYYGYVLRAAGPDRQFNTRDDITREYP